VNEYTLANAHGMEAKIIPYGGIVTALSVPDRHGQLANVVLGFDNLDDYQTKNHPYFGALIGRYGNRIGNAGFTLDGMPYKLPVNNGPNSLHGGNAGFDKQTWTVDEASSSKLALSYLSKDGEEGYPGNLTTRVIYSVTNDNELRIDYTATTDKTTVVNLTNHSYFNLSGSGSIYDHIVTINANTFTVIDDTLIPTSELARVEGTPFDFRQPKCIGTDIRSAHPQMVVAHGFDHNFVINRPADNSLVLAARVSDPASGRVMEVLTTEPGVQFYTGNFLDGTLVGSGGRTIRQSDALCLETQHFPDSPNKPDFPSTVLKPGETYQSTTVYKFSTSG